jgi:hypothetical protein
MWTKTHRGCDAQDNQSQRGRLTKDTSEHLGKELPAEKSERKERQIKRGTMSAEKSNDE